MRIKRVSLSTPSCTKVGVWASLFVRGVWQRPHCAGGIWKRMFISTVRLPMLIRHENGGFNFKTGAPFTRVTNFCTDKILHSSTLRAFTRDRRKWTNSWTGKDARLEPEKRRSQTCTLSRSKIRPVLPVSCKRKVELCKFLSVQKFVRTRVNEAWLFKLEGKKRGLNLTQKRHPKSKLKFCRHYSRRIWKTEVSLWKCIRYFPSTLRQKNLETLQSSIILNLVAENSVRETKCHR